jgi:hypothetical protein
MRIAGLLIVYSRPVPTWLAARTLPTCAWGCAGESVTFATTLENDLAVVTNGSQARCRQASDRRLIPKSVNKASSSSGKAQPDRAQWKAGKEEEARRKKEEEAARKEEEQRRKAEEEFPFNLRTAVVVSAAHRLMQGCTAKSTAAEAGKSSSSVRVLK